jgi:hypothetical protein
MQDPKVGNIGMQIKLVLIFLFTHLLFIKGFRFHNSILKHTIQLKMNMKTEEKMQTNGEEKVSCTKSEGKVSRKSLRVVEFFSGIGGWASALQLQKDLIVDFHVVAAYDVNSVSNEVYEFNHNHKPSSSSIESLTVKVLDSLEADIWVMSPPCQPYTRQHPPTENDLRNNALLNLISTLKKLKKPPTYLALENVIGFEESASCSTLLDTLGECFGFYCWQFCLIHILYYLYVHFLTSLLAGLHLCGRLCIL